MAAEIGYYDNGDDGAGKNFLDVDRVYGIHHDMTGLQWQRLADIYRTLPGWSADLGPGAWFGPEGAPGGWLVASVEPSGLQVSGRLPGTAWQRWTLAFTSAINHTDFPRTDNF